MENNRHFNKEFATWLSKNTTVDYINNYIANKPIPRKFATKLIRLAIKLLKEQYKEKDSLGMCKKLMKAIRLKSGNPNFAFNNSTYNILQDLFPNFNQNNYHKIINTKYIRVVYWDERDTIEGFNNRIKFLNWMISEYEKEI